MAVHTIMLPDRLYGDEPRSVIRDDVAGTVEGTYSDVPVMRRTLARPTPVNGSSDERVLYLHNPAHDPAEFLWLIGTAFSGILYEPLRSTPPRAMPMAISPDTSTTANRSGSAPATESDPDGTGRPCCTIASPLQAGRTGPARPPRGGCADGTGGADLPPVTTP